MRAVWLSLWLCACTGFDKQSVPDLSVMDLAGTDFDGVDLAQVKHDLGAAGCRTLPLPCLDVADVIEAPTEVSVQEAFATAVSGDIIQIRGLNLGAGFRVPPGVTLRGCEGAQITETIAFEGTSGVIEGFEVPGSIIANRTGTFTIRANRFIDGGASDQYGVSARANDGLTSANVTANIEGNWFTARKFGVEGLTAYDTLVHTVNLNVRNNIFFGIPDFGINLDEGGLVGQIHADLAFNTFFSNGFSIKLTDVQANTAIRASMFYLGGGFAVLSDSPYYLSDVYYYGVISSSGVMPISGTFLMTEPMYVDWPDGDLHYLPGSPLLDVVPGGPDVPMDDYYGCPRPVGGGADVGAVENQ